MIPALPELYRNDTLSKNTNEFAEKNPWNFVEGDKVKLVCGNFTQFARVSLLAGVEQKDVAHVLSSKWKGDLGIHGSVQKVSASAFTSSLLRSSVKLRIGFICAIVAIGSAYVNAALTKDGTFQFHLGAGRWLLFAPTAAATLGAWTKDIWSQ